MTFDQNMWNNTKADGEFAESNQPPAGWSGIVSIAEAKFAQTGPEKNVPTIIVEYRTADGVYRWADIKKLTSEGRIKSAKILMKDLGLDPNAATTPEGIHAALRSVEGAYYAVAVEASNQLKQDGTPFTNTRIIGRQQASVASQPPAVQAPTQVGGHQFPSAVAPAQPQPSPMGAEFGDKAPWE